MSEWYLQKRLTDPAFGASKPKGDAMFHIVRSNGSSKGPCWTGYHRDYNKAEGTNDSCVKNGTKKTIKKKRKSKTGKRKKRQSKKDNGKESSTDGSSTDSGNDSKKKS